MILYHDTIGQVPDVKSTTCEYHKLHPGKPFAGCFCSFSMGYRKATPEERRANLLKHRQELQEQANDLAIRLEQVDGELGKG